MVKQKNRTLEELYSVTEPILEFEITPVLRGSCRMQGPVSETDERSCSDTVKNKILSQAGQEAGCHSMRHKAPALAESGTCNLCSAPCSSCLDLNRDNKRLKTEDFHRETCHRHAESQYSINEADGCSLMKSRECDNLQHTSSETSNILTATSSHDSFSENAVNKAKLRYSDITSASEDAEMCPKSELVDVPNMTMLHDKFENTRRIECDDDNCSSASGANDAKIVDKLNNIRVDTDNLLCSSSVSSFVPLAFSNKVCSERRSEAADPNFDVEERHRNLGRQSSYVEDSKQKMSLGLLSEQNAHQFEPSYPVSKDDDTGCSSPNVHNTHSLLDSRESPSCNFKEELSSICQKKRSDLSIRRMDSSLKKEEASPIHSNKKPDWIGILQNNERSLLGGVSEVCRGVDLKSEAEINHNSMSDDALQCSGENEQIMTSNLDDETELHDSVKPRLQSISEDKNDESDIVEVDVNICDICGDAGKEYLLAICTKCGDGAEHTYCMREKLEQVPKGEWLCEECKLDEIKKKMREVEAVNESAKKQCPGYTRSVRTDPYVKWNSKDVAVDTKRSNKLNPITHVRKRPFDSLDADSGVKRLVLETNARSPKLHSPSRTTSLSRDSFLKNSDREKVKLAHQMSFGPATTSPRFQTARGSLLKSNSFNSFNHKPRVVADDGIHHEQKATRELGTSESKEGRLKKMRRSISLKSDDSVRSSALDSKVKMLSPRFPHPQDIKGIGKEKDWNKFERKKSFKLDDPVASLARANSTVSARQGDKDFTSRIERVVPPAASNQRVSKPGQAVGRFTSSNPTRSVPRKTLEIPVGSITSNGVRIAASAEEKSNLVSPKKEAIGSTSHNTKKASEVHAVDALLSFSRESENQAERTGDNLTPRPRQGVRLASPRPSVVDPFGTRSSKDAVNNGSTLKDALHAALLKKPGIYKNSRVPDQSDGALLSKTETDSNLGVASQEKLAISSIFKNINTGERAGKPIVMGNISSTCQQTNSSVKQVSVYPTDHLMSTFLKTVPIPEHEYIWQGDFEVHRSRKVPELCAGIQAHLSSCASPRVVEVVNKFSSRVPLTEVSRRSIWPAQFHDRGPTEDHIALYFFAKDVTSYEVNYTSLLDSMMKNDVALKGSTGGVELLIFSSNHLPKKSQRWNTLFFLWGVFRAKKVGCSDHMLDHSNLDVSGLKIVRVDKQLPTAFTSFSEKIYSPRYIDQESTGCDKVTNLVLDSPTNGSPGVIAGNGKSVPSSLGKMFSGFQGRSEQPGCDKVSNLVLDSPTNGSPGVIAGNGKSVPSSLGKMFSGFQGRSEQPDSILNSQTLSGVQTNNKQLCAELGHQTPQEPNAGEACKLEVELLSPTQEMLSDVDVCTTSLQEVNFIVKLNPEKMSDRLNDIDHMKTEINVNSKEGSDIEIYPEKNTRMRDLSQNENDRKHPHFFVTASEAPSCCKSEETVSMKLKVEQTEGSKSDSCIDINALPEDSGTSCSLKCTEAWDMNLMKSLEDRTLAERHFFPIASHPVKEFQMGHGSSIPWVSNRPLHDDLQNVDLALWVDTKLPEQQIPVLPLFPDTTEEKQNDPQEDDNNSPVSLSLSLAFPSAENKKPDNKVASKIERDHHVNTPFLLFRDFPSK